jgi:uncharacterized protein YjbI with pentapeptide repeats
MILHFYMLAQLKMMARKVVTYLKEAGDDPERLKQCAGQLDSFAVAQLLAAKRLGQRPLALELMVWVTLAVAPISLLLFVQVRFLPYHDTWITAWHRLVLLADLVVLWWLWPRATPMHRLRTVPYLAVGALASVLTLVFSGVLATISRERLDSVAEMLPGSLPPFVMRVESSPMRIFWWRLRNLGETPAEVVESAGIEGRSKISDEFPLPQESLAVGLRRALFDGGVDTDTQRPRSMFSRSLVLRDAVLIAPEDLTAFRNDPERARLNITRTRVLRKRDLRDAVLDRADLRRVDLTGARLTGASLLGAKLTGATLERAHMPYAPLGEAQLQYASLDGARMWGATLDHADMQGASFTGADLRGANFDGARSQGASFDRAWLQGARFDGAQLQGASFVGAQLQAASFANARLQGIWLKQAQLQGAWLGETDMRGAMLGAVGLWRLRSVDTDLRETLVEDPRFDEAPSCAATEVTADCSPAGSWKDTVKAWLTQFDDRGEQSRMMRIFSVLTDADDPPEAAGFRDKWSKPGPSRQVVVKRLGDLACDPAYAPHVARSLLLQIRPWQTNSRDLDDDRVALAKRIADNCPGARGLTETERAILAGIIASEQDSPRPGAVADAPAIPPRASPTPY